MGYSISSILTTIFLSSIMIIFIWLVFENTRVIKYFNVNSILFCIIIVAIRPLLPIEMDITKSIPSKFLMTNLVFYLKKPLLITNRHSITFFCIFFCIWLLGIIYISLKIIFVYVKLNRIINILPPINDKHIQKILDKVINNYSYYVEFKVVNISGPIVPFIYNARKPIIVLPKITFTDDELYYILSHETTHYYNHDFLFKAIIGFLCILYWWNPIMFLLKKQIVTWLEIRADITATKSLNNLETIGYVECLLKVAGFFKVVNSNNIFSTFHNNTPLLKKRFYATKFYKKEKIPSKEFKNNFLIIILVSIIIYMSFLIVFEPYYVDPSEIKDTIELTEKTTYLFENEKGNYDIYFNGEYYATVSKIPNSLSKLPIYK